MNMYFACMRAIASVEYDSATLWTAAHQASLSMGSSRQEYCSGFPCPPPGDLPDPGIEPTFLMSNCVGRRVLYHLCHQGSLI